MTPVDHDMAVDDANNIDEEALAVEAAIAHEEDHGAAEQAEAEEYNHREAMANLAEGKIGDLKPEAFRPHVPPLRKRKVDGSTPEGVPLLVWSKGYPAPLLVERAPDGLFYDIDVISDGSWVEAVPVKTTYGSMEDFSYVTVAELDAVILPAE
jgi:hypothetical protein